MNVSIVIATRPGRPGQAWRTHEAYLRETPGDPLIVVAPDPSYATAWQIGVRQVLAHAERCELADNRGVVHFTTDEVEPHPGWLESAVTAIDASCVAAPMIWTPAGKPETVGRDWSAAVRSEYPTMSLQQLRTFGVPPLAADCGARFAIRAEYAFTRWDD